MPWVGEAPHRAKVALCSPKVSIRSWPTADILEPVGREVLIVLERVPVATPAPPERPEGLDGHVARVDHASGPHGSVNESGATRRKDHPARDLGILQRIDVDGPSVGVLGPGARSLHGP